MALSYPEPRSLYPRPMLALLLSSLPVLLSPQEELQPVEILDHDENVCAVATDSKEKSLYTIDAKGVVRRWEMDGTGPLWESAPHDMSDPRFGNAEYGLAIGEDVGARIGPGPVAEFQSVDLETGGITTGIASLVGGKDLTQTYATKAVIVDPRDRWVWIGGQIGVARLMAKGTSGWSSRGMPNGGSLCFALDPKANELAVGGEDGSIRFVGNKSANVEDKFFIEAHGKPVNALAWDPKGKLIASAADDSNVIVHKRRDGKVAHEFEPPFGDVAQLAFHPKGKWLAAGTERGRIALWDLKSGELLAEATLPEKRGGVHSLFVLDKGKTLVAAGSKCVVRIDVESVGK